MAAKQRTFRAVLEKGSRALGWTVVRVPFDPHAVWPDMVRRRVAGEINGVAFRTSLFPDTRGGSCVLVNRQMQRAADVALGDSASFVLGPDLEPRPAEIPDELDTLLEDEPALQTWFASLTESMRREIGKWVAAPKTEEARMRRAQQTAERLLATMEAERELPPAIQAAFRRRPRARAGWEKMSPNQRRSHLMGVFHYQTPEARERRIDKLCDTAEQHAGSTPRNRK